MGTRLAGRNRSGGTTDHSTDIELLRNQAERWGAASFAGSIYACAADLLEVHDDSGISLDDWSGPRNLVEQAMLRCNAGPFVENNV